MRRTWLPIAVLLAFLAPGAPGQSRTPEGPRAAGRPARAAAVVGALDPTFGSGGKVTTDFFGDQDQASDLAVQSDGRLVVAGVAGRPGGKASFALARYNSDGSLDPSFGAGGKVTTDISPVDDQGGSAIVQSDGKILLAGIAGGVLDVGLHGPVILYEEEGSTTRCDIALVRYDADGSVDESFGTAGKLTADFFGSSDAARFVRQPDGKVVGAGFSRRERASAFYGSRLISKWAARLGAVPDTDFALLRFDTGDIAAPDFSLAAAPPSATAARRATVPVTIDVARVGGFSGEVTVVAPNTRTVKVKAAPARATTPEGVSRSTSRSRNRAFWERTGSSSRAGIPTGASVRPRSR